MASCTEMLACTLFDSLHYIFVCVRDVAGMFAALRKRMDGKDDFPSKYLLRQDYDAERAVLVLVDSLKSLIQRRFKKAIAVVQAMFVMYWIKENKRQWKRQAA